MLYSEDYPQVVLDAYLERYGALDIGRKRRGEPGLEVWNLALLYGDQLGEFEKSEFYRDFLVPNQILDSMGMTVVVSRSTALATLFLHSEQAGRPEFGERGLALLSLLFPAFNAGVRDLVRYSHQQESLAAHLDALSEGIRITDLSGVTIHQNPAFTAALGGAGVHERLDPAIHEIVRALVQFPEGRSNGGGTLAGKRIAQEIHTPAGEYRVHGTFLGRELLGAELRIAILLQRMYPIATLSDRSLESRFGLTPRELEIARRVAQGDSTKEIADVCSISLHTARRHTEKIFAKLGVRSRAQVGPRLHGD